MASGTSVSVDGNNQRRTIAAKGGTVVVNGNNNQITVMGNCASLTVNGSNNSIHAAQIAQINTPGNNNIVTWRGSKTPSISNLGNDNAVHRAK